MLAWEYASLEWIWDQGGIRVNLPDGTESTAGGSYAEVVETLTQLGRQGWEVAACVAMANWLYWTLQRPLT